MQFGLVDKRPAFAEFSGRATARPAFKRATEIEQREAAKK
jgi:hypothetical protein